MSVQFNLVFTYILQKHWERWGWKAKTLPASVYYWTTERCHCPVSKQWDWLALITRERVGSKTSSRSVYRFHWKVTFCRRPSCAVFPQEKPKRSFSSCWHQARRLLSQSSAELGFLSGVHPALTDRISISHHLDGGARCEFNYRTDV